MADKKSLPWGLKTDHLTPGSMKTISENKLKAFSLGSMNRKGLTKKEQEEIKKKSDQQAAAECYEEFVASFEDSGKLNKSWVKGGIAGSKKETHSKSQSDRLYKPTSKLAELASTFQSKKSDEDKSESRPVGAPSLGLNKRTAEMKRKSNLEQFKEELKHMQQQRDERHKYKRELGIMPPRSEEPPPRKSRFESNSPPPPPVVLAPPEDDPFEPAGRGSDSMSTNIYLGNINPQMSEPQLCELFGKYGPLASVKIMWPRSEEERSRNSNCGFVAYMNRKDGERAMKSLQGEMIQDFEMKLGWGKAVPIPPHPVYVPPSMVELNRPPPQSGLPFNAQTRLQPFPGPPGNPSSFAPPTAYHDYPDEMQKTLATAVVKVMIPSDRALLCVIHRIIEFVVREGPMFEAMIMNKEINNPMYRFLFENKTPAHIYYRWKLFSILQGERPYNWSTKDFRMFKGGSLWRPPPQNPYSQGMPEDLVHPENRKGQLSESQRDRLEDMLRELTPEKEKIGDVMVWCLEHAESAEEIVDCISESLAIIETPIPKKISRLFLINDILYNCSAKVSHVSFFRKFFGEKLEDIFQDLHNFYQKIDGRLKAEQFKNKVMLCFRSWEDWAVYPKDMLINLQNVFFGLVPSANGNENEDLDGVPVEFLNPDVDGMPLDQPKTSLVDYDGEPFDIDGVPLDGEEHKHEDSSKQEVEPPSKRAPVAAFMASKWETVDESQLEAQAMTTSKWEVLGGEQEDVDDSQNSEVDGQPMDLETSDEGDNYQAQDGNQREISEQRRAKLREIELKVVKYQDELEMGKRSRKSGVSVTEQIHNYRQKLLNKEEEKEKKEARERLREMQRKEERERVREWERARNKERERQDPNSFSESARSRHRSRTPSPPSAYRNSPMVSLVAYHDSSQSPRHLCHRSCSGSPHHRNKSRRSRSHSFSPVRSKHKSKKSRR